MKLNLLARATGLMALCATLAYADGYDGGPLKNYNGTYTGDITVTGIVNDNLNGVYRDIGSGTTKLQGNILVDVAYGSGVENCTRTANSYIVLETLSDADSIVIRTTSERTDSAHPDGISQSARNGSLTINANKDGSFQELNITAGGNGIVAYAGTLTVNANTVINCESEGIGVGSLSDYSTSYTSKVVMSGTLDITSGYYAITGHSSLDMSAVTNTKIVSSYGIYCGSYSTSRGRFILGSHLDMTVTGDPEGRAIQANSGVISGTGKYIFAGKVEASGKEGKVDLTFTNGSNFTGYTQLNPVNILTTCEIDFSLNKGARWELTTNSSMSNLNVDQGGLIVFDLFVSSWKMFSCINAPEVTLASGSILALNMDPSRVQVGDEYTLFNGLTTFDNDTNGVLNALLRSADGLYQYEYDNPTAGVFRILGISSIPEPATASLGLFGLAGLMLRRRRV